MKFDEILTEYVRRKTRGEEKPQEWEDAVEMYLQLIGEGGYSPETARRVMNLYV